jgi:hypothetical protein
MEGWPQLLQLLCTDAATPLLLRLKVLRLLLERGSDNQDGPHDALLCRLGALPSPPVLQHFSAVL